MSELLNLGCGTDYKDGWLNLDVSADVDPDLQHDLNDTPWPLDDDSCSHVEARHVLEHLDDIDGALEEIGRVLRPRGTLNWVYPIGHTRFEDTTHTQFWNYNSGEFQAGERGAHRHEVMDCWELVGQNCDWGISRSEPLVVLYAKYRELVRGPGAWLEQIPGLYGEMNLVYQYKP